MSFDINSLRRCDMTDSEFTNHIKSQGWNGKSTQQGKYRCYILDREQNFRLVGAQSSIDGVKNTFYIE